MTNLNGERAALSRVFVQCKKNRPKILTDFGCLLESSGGIDGDHSLVEVDGSGLAWKAGFRYVIRWAVYITDLIILLKLPLFIFLFSYFDPLCLI